MSFEGMPKSAPLMGSEGKGGKPGPHRSYPGPQDSIYTLLSCCGLAWPHVHTGLDI